MALLPPAPSWYCTHAASCTDDGTYAYAERSSVYVLNLNAAPATLLQSIDRCHSERVTAVALGGPILYTASEDGRARCWDWRNRKCLGEHSAHLDARSRSAAKVTCGVLTLHHNNGAAFATGDERGKLVVWHDGCTQDRDRSLRPQQKLQQQLSHPSSTDVNGGSDGDEESQACSQNDLRASADAAASCSKTQQCASATLDDGSPILTLAFSNRDATLLAAGTKKGMVYVLQCCAASAGTPALPVQHSQPASMPGGCGNGSGLVVLMKLKGHDDEIHSVAWMPSMPSDRSEGILVDGGARPQLPAGTDSRPFDLASGSKDRTVKLWSMAKQRCTVTLRLPNSTGVRLPMAASKHGDATAASARLWVALAWPSPGTLVSSSHGGQLLIWDMEAGGQECHDSQPDAQHRQLQQRLAAGEPSPGAAIAWRLLDDEHLRHTRIVFTAAPWGRDRLVTTSLDRTIVVWDLRGQRGVQKMFALGGFAYSVRSSPHDPGRIAVGVGDSMIRVWNTNAVERGHEVKEYWRGIKAKVTTIAWHPWHEGRLAYGTEDGRIGVLQILSDKPPLVFSTFHRNTVYVVAWGPLYGAGGVRAVAADAKSSLQPPLAVYSVGDGVILLHDPSAPDSDSADLNSLLERKNPWLERRIRSEISWCADLDLLAVGNDDGSVLLVRCDDLSLACQVRVAQKLINALRWHPNCASTTAHSISDADAVASDDGSKSVVADAPAAAGAATAAVDSAVLLPHRGWLAIASNEERVYVVNALHRPQTVGEQAVLVTPVATLVGHQGRVTDVCWSPHGGARLASASYDGTIMIWDIRDGDSGGGSALLAVLRGHSGRVFTCLWSHIDPDLVFSGGDDFTVRTWHVSQHEVSSSTVAETIAAADMHIRRAVDGPKKKKKYPKKTVKNNKQSDASAALSSASVTYSQSHDVSRSTTDSDLCAGGLAPTATATSDLLALVQQRKAQLLVVSAAADGLAAGSAHEVHHASSVQPLSPAAAVSDPSLVACASDTEAAGNLDYAAISSVSTSATAAAAQADGGETVQPSSRAVFTSVLQSRGLPVAEQFSSSPAGESQRLLPASHVPKTAMFSAGGAASDAAAINGRAGRPAASHRRAVDSSCRLLPASSTPDAGTRAGVQQQVQSQRKKTKALVTASALVQKTTRADYSDATAAGGSSKDAATLTAALQALKPVQQPLLNDCLYIASAIGGGEVDSDHLHLGLFCGKREAQQFVDAEVDRLLETATAAAEATAADGSGVQVATACHQSALQMLLWRGDVEKAVELAADRSSLTDWLVSAAAMISFEFHLRYAEVYARQLAAAGDPQKAALYYLMCHKTREAIGVLLENGLFGDALCIAQSHLVEDDPLTLTVHRSWAQHLERSGSHELAARSWLSCKQPHDAVRALARRGTAAGHVAAARLAVACALPVDACVHADRAWRQALTADRSAPDFVSADQAAAVHPDGQALLRRSLVYRRLLRRLPLPEGMQSSPWPGEETAVDEQPLLRAIATDWERHGVAPARSQLPAPKPSTAHAHASIDMSPMLPPHETLLAAAFAVTEATELLLVPAAVPVTTPTDDDCHVLPARSTVVPAAVAEAPQEAAAVYHKLLEALTTLANGGLARQAAFLELAVFDDSGSDRAERQTADEQQDSSAASSDVGASPLRLGEQDAAKASHALNGSATVDELPLSATHRPVYIRLLHSLRSAAPVEQSDCNLVGPRRAWRLYSLAEVTYWRCASKLLAIAGVGHVQDAFTERALACLKLIEQMTATATVVDSAGAAKRRAASAADEAASAAARCLDTVAMARRAEAPCGCATAEHCAEAVGEMLLDSREFAEDVTTASRGDSTVHCSSTAHPAQPSVMCSVRDAAATSGGVPAASDAAVSTVGPKGESFGSHCSSGLAGELVSELPPRRLAPSVFLPAVKLAWCCCVETIVPMCAHRSDVQQPLPPRPLATASRLLDRATSAASAAAAALRSRSHVAETTTRAAMLDAVRGLLSAQQRLTA